MSRRVAFRQCDLERAIRALKATGEGVARVEIDRDGKIIVVPGKPPENVPSLSDERPHDRDLEIVF